MTSKGRVKQHHQCHSRSSHQINGLTTDELILAYQVGFCEGCVFPLRSKRNGISGGARKLKSTHRGPKS